MSVATGPKWGLYSRLFARYYDRFQADYEKHIAGRKRKLFDGVKGTVLEIGPGTGANFQYLPSGSRWIGVEPNPYMHGRLRERARAAGIEPEIHTTGRGEFLVDDEVADVAISTIVLCSVPDLDQTLSEIRRVLKPGGRFLFIEHVAAARGSVLRVVQHVLKPVWYLFGNGCRVNRDTRHAIESAGFSSFQIEDFRVPRGLVPPWVTPHIAGHAVR